ncbi:SRPBCC family protein [Oceanobacillus manasiensis]|uniref:SRPBCC family protein n=1 Tax=Oceanobacillus manasiensis TaxID=586413 RepID=UPI0005A7160A|nr:SRPBCC domain-containing protein [Oceanobacillus manasiensis]
MKEQKVFTIEDVIEAPIELVFDCINDDEKIKQWNELLIENIYPSREAKEAALPGTKFQTVQLVGKKVFTIDSELIEFAAPHLIVMNSYSKEGTSITRYKLNQENKSTRLTLESSMIPSNLYYLILTKMTGWLAKFAFQEQFEKLKDYVEEEQEYGA